MREIARCGIAARYFRGQGRLRTIWSRSSNVVRQRNWRSGGIGAGPVMILLSILLRDPWHLLAVTVTSTVWPVACIVASHHYYEKKQEL